eukprot:TRINITY_DN2137_c0_g1_i1.p2 TRINITY_DN2137_c0_g1~~TRINITY_DN2137_c0_g1_i1.p2  ORF type:complete len:195 (+),score=66.51 TRINITY_DN2137_c0_g1_i1:494-1078(+)
MSNCGKKSMENVGHHRTQSKGQEQEKPSKSTAQSQRASVKSLERVMTAKAISHTPLLQKTQTVANAKISKEHAGDTPTAEQKCNGNLTERRQSATTKPISKKSTLGPNIGKSIILQMIRVPGVTEKLNNKFKPCLTERRKTSPTRPGDKSCLLYTSPSPRDLSTSRMPSSACKKKKKNKKKKQHKKQKQKKKKK